MGFIPNIPSVSDLIHSGLEIVAPASKAITGALQTISAPETQAQGDQKRLAQSAYDYNYIQYPSDLGEGFRHPYYMTFYVNVQDLSKWATPPPSTKDFGPFQQIPKSTVDINTRENRTIAKNAGDTGLGFGRKTSRTKTAIRLFMPDTLSWSFANSFRDVSLSGLPFAGLAQGIASLPALGTSMAEGYKKGGPQGILASIVGDKTSRAAAGPVAEFIGNRFLGEGGDKLALSIGGIAVNPQVDVIYESPTLRSFTFDFLFAPRSVAEALAVESIVWTFKFHSAPEILAAGAGFGRYFVPPSEFDIEFSVSTMGKISTCVLETVTVDYAPSGAAFYDDNQPMYTRMTLQFKELEFITKNLIEEKGY